jgi:hypothetical protein
MLRSPRNVIALVFSGFAVGIAIALFMLREPTEPLTAKSLQEARDRWKAAGIKNYDMSYRMHGSVYGIQVRAGIVSDVRVNGLAPTSTDWKTYSVDGLFDILGMDLESFRTPTNQVGGPQVIMRVRFHPQLGYVERYVRSGSPATDATIELISFEQKNLPGDTKK